MSAVILGSRGASGAVCTARYQGVTYWPERGLVHSKRDRDGDYHCVQVPRMLKHIRGLQNILKESRRVSETALHQAHYWDIQQAIEDLTRVCRVAQEQGMPSDASARRDLARRQRRTFVCSEEFSL